MTTKPQLKNLDALFGIDENFGITVVELPINSLIPYEPQPFKMYTEDERMGDLVESIKTHGVLTPILVRPKSTFYEILAGRHRTKGSELAGLKTVPSIILNNITDEQALAYVIETNLMQRSFSDMLHSEKAAVILLHHSKMFSQGKRNDIVEQLKNLEHIAHTQVSSSTFCQVEKRLRTHDKVAQEYGLSKETVARYLRISKLLPQLQEILDKGEMPFIAAVAISFLREKEQVLLVECLNNHPYSVDMKKADIMKEYSKSNKLNENNIMLILSGKLPPKSQKQSVFKFNKTTYDKYFTQDQSSEEVQSIIDAALEMYYRSKEDM